MKTIRLYDIEWDDTEDTSHLPTEVFIDNPTQAQIDALTSYDDELADYVSDLTGYCVRSFRTELKEG